MSCTSWLECSSPRRPDRYPIAPKINNAESSIQYITFVMTLFLAIGETRKICPNAEDSANFTSFMGAHGTSDRAIL